MTRKVLLRSADPGHSMVEARAEEKAAGAHAQLANPREVPHGTVFDDLRRALDLGSIERTGIFAKTFDDVYGLGIAGYRLDAEHRTVVPAAPAGLGLSPTDADAWRFRLMFLEVPVHPRVVHWIEAHGAFVRERLTTFVLLVEATAAQRDAMRADLQLAPVIRWDIPFLPALRIAGSVARQLRLRPGDPPVPGGALEVELRDVVVVVRGRRAAGQVRAAIRAGGGTVKREARPGHGQRSYFRVIGTVRGSTVLDLARDIEEVRWIETFPERLEPEGERSAAVLARRFLAGSDPQEPRPVYMMWLSALGVDGAGCRIAVCDSGVYQNHPSLIDAVQATLAYGDATMTTDFEGHGTHVAGIAAGRPTGWRDDGDFDLGLGVAPAAEIVSLRILTGGIFLMPDPAPGSAKTSWQVPVADSYRAGARVVNNSWGINIGVPDPDYGDACADFDALVRHADPGVKMSGPISIVFSAGNLGKTGMDSLTAPKALKNAIVVGASGGGAAVDGIDHWEVSPYSSRGWTADGRVAPLVVAPGVGITSARTTYCSGDAGATCMGERTTFTTDTGLEVEYVQSSGTSMAAPHVSGALALLIQRWGQAFGNGEDGAAAAPTPAMLKAIVVNTATDLTRKVGSTAAVGPVPDPAQGWGLVDLENALRSDGEQFKAGRILDDDPDHAIGDDSRVRLYRVRVVDTDRPLRVTLAWTDLPGPHGVEDRALINDLDLLLVDSSSATPSYFKGNRRFSYGFSDDATGDTYDHIDNVECVYIQVPAAVYDLYVFSLDLAESPGEPEDFIDPWQDYALVVDNGVFDGDSTVTKF